MTCCNLTNPEHLIENVGEKLALVLYLLIACLSSLIGDSLILVATTRFKAIKLNKLIVTIMQHIAACDLLLSVTCILPTIVSLITDPWIFGFESVIVYFLVKVGHDSSRSLMAFLTVCKLYIIKCPVSSQVRLKKVAHLVSSSIWLLGIVFHGSLLATRQCEPYFSYCEYFIQCHLKSDVARDIIVWSTLMINAIPTLIILVSTTAILYHLRMAMKVSRRIGGSVRWHGMAAVSITAIVFCVAAIPSLIANAYIAIESTTSEIVLDEKEIGLLRTSHFAFVLNIMCNIYIYYFTIPSFRRFVNCKILARNTTELQNYSSERFPSKTTIGTIRLETFNFSRSNQVHRNPQVQQNHQTLDIREEKSSIRSGI